MGLHGDRMRVQAIRFASGLQLREGLAKSLHDFLPVEHRSAREASLLGDALRMRKPLGIATV
ncbi:MAG TPA: hypothetical protein VLJ37_12575 [bacterium]|nr:hypothetical protein [bacterium]